jgi:hypothetical protein
MRPVIHVVSKVLVALALALLLGEAARAGLDNPPMIAPQSGPLDSGMGLMQAATVGRSVVAIAKNEFDRFGGSRNLDPTLNVNAWSAAFVSFCVKQSGATSSQFAFSMQHSVFVHAAIANANANRGVFRGHRVTEYAPKLGDLIHHNRDGS